MTGNKHNPVSNGLELSRALVDQELSPRSVVEQENIRVNALLSEVSQGPGEPSERLRLLDRGLLQDHSEQSQVQDSLGKSRDMLIQLVNQGVDDVQVDKRLGLRTEESILPPLFRELHRQAELNEGRPISFLEWMAVDATDDQLLNVWQWHDGYLRERNNDQTFQEQISRVKDGYLYGTKIAIDAGDLHPSMAIDVPDMDSHRIVHGSPFSPILAGAHAYVDHESGTIQLRDEVPDYTLYHELTHVLKPGLGDYLNEGPTDIIATTVYNHAHPESERIALDQSVYYDEIATLQSIERMTRGKVGMYALSEACAGANANDNLLQLAVSIDKATGVAIGAPLLDAPRAIFASLADNNVPFNRVILDAKYIGRETTELIETALLDEHGGQGTRPAELAQRIDLVAPLGQYEQEVVDWAQYVVAKAAEVERIYAQWGLTPSGERPPSNSVSLQPLS